MLSILVAAFAGRGGFPPRHSPGRKTINHDHVGLDPWRASMKTSTLIAFLFECVSPGFGRASCGRPTRRWQFGKSLNIIDVWEPRGHSALMVSPDRENPSSVLCQRHGFLIQPELPAFSLAGATTNDTLFPRKSSAPNAQLTCVLTVETGTSDPARVQKCY